MTNKQERELKELDSMLAWALHHEYYDDFSEILDEIILLERKARRKRLKSPTPSQDFNADNL